MVGVGGNTKFMRGRWQAANLARAGTAMVVVAGVVTVAFASGYSATRAVTKGDSAWLRKGDTVVHVNGPSARFDAVVSDRPTALAASRSDPMEVVQQPDGRVYTADPVTHQVYRIDPITMTPQPGPPGTAILASGSTTYVVDRESGTVTPVDPQTLAPGRPFNVPRPIVSQAIGPDGTAYVSSAGGTVTTIKGGKVTTSQVAAAGQPLDLTVVGSQPAAVDPVNGTLYPLGSLGTLGSLGSGHLRALPLPGLTGAPMQMAPSLSGHDVWLIRGATLVAADPATGQTQSVGLPNGDAFGAPVVDANRVYVPDETQSAVLVFDATALTQADRIAVPHGAAGSNQIEIVVQDGKVWVDNPTSRDGKLVSPDGTAVTVDKGTGNQVVDPNGPPSPAPVSTPVTPPAASPSPLPMTGPVVSPTPISLPPTPPVAIGPAPAGPGPGSGRRSGPGSGPGSSTTPPAPSVPNPNVPPPTTSTTQPSGKVPKLIGLDPTAACAALRGASPPLACAPHDQGQAPSGKAAGLVTAQSPAAGATAVAGTKVIFDYYGSLAVPGFSGQAPGTYCATADSLGLKCTPSASQGPYGAQVNVVQSVSPGAGSVVPYGTPVTASYYSSTQGPPKQIVPPCIGDAPPNCPNPGLTYVQVPQSIASSVACNTVYQQNPPAGTVVDQGSQVQLYYDPNCAVGLYEWTRKNTHIWYLSTSSSTPGNDNPTNPWQSHGAAAGAYPFVNNSCAKAGTTPLYSWQYTSHQVYPHHYFTIDPNWHDPNWNALGVVACVFNTKVPGSYTVYGHYINRGQPPPGDWYWSLGAGSDGVAVWYQPPP